MPTETFSFTGGWQKFNVPAGVKVIDVEMTGGGSGLRHGGRVTGKIRVDGNDVLWIMVGRRGHAADGNTGGGGAFGGGQRGGNGKGGSGGGDGGGGASAIRMNKVDGPIRAVAGGAGGTSADGGAGGRGGAEVGEPGFRGTAGSGATALSIGGTQNQAGKGGTSSISKAFWGGDGEQERLGTAGRGAGPDQDKVRGGGGGGGGYYPGGGGAAGRVGDAPGIGGAGGSNYIGGMFSAESFRGTGGTGHGSVTLSWTTDVLPTPPEDITINGQPISDGLATKATTSVIVAGTPDSPDSTRGVRMLIWMSRDPNFATHSNWSGTYDPADRRDKVTITGLQRNTRYYLRLYTKDINGEISTTYRATNFWTNRPPNEPVLVSPVENAQVSSLLNLTFQWNHSDPDPSSPQSAFELRYRTAPTPIAPAGEWVSVGQHTGATETWTIDGGTFKGNTFYEWQVRTRDAQGDWGPWCLSNSFYVTASTTPPLIIGPERGTAIVAAQANRFRWTFRDPERGVIQARADIRYRPFGGGDDDWITLLGTVSEPGMTQWWDIPAETFAEKMFYEWQVRTVGSTAKTSDWSNSAYFWSALAPGSGAGQDLIASGRPQDPLSVGNNRAFIYARGGQVRLGEIKPLTSIKWNRKRDDISGGTLIINQWDSDARAFLGSLRSWVHEVVVFRNGVRVFEGPITKIASSKKQVEIEFKDPMAYVYRRIMRQGYSDAYRVLNGEQLGLTTVVKRAAQIVLNALAYDDPNVLPYLTLIENKGDAQNSRVRKDFSSTAWEEIDDLAAHAGLDYTTSGRRIIFWDTHRPIGRLPEMRDGDFSDPPIITEYGMAMANVFGVTNNNGLYGVAYRGVGPDNVPTGPEGFVEQLASSYGENEGAGSERTLTREARKRLIATLTAQADRNIAGRWTSHGPSPLVVRVPDNSTLNPEINVGINQLVPGVWIPLRCEDGIREVTQWQKLDAVGVEQDGNGERISIVMSPAPNEGQDPDADAAVEEGL